MAYLGLRVGEVVDVMQEDIDRKKHLIYVRTEKAKTLDCLYIHEKIRHFIYLWIDNNKTNIKKNGGYLLYSGREDRQNISENWLRNKFRQTAKRAQLDDHYALSSESIEDRPTRKLHRLTTHSLRHYFITKVYKKTKNPIHTQKLARHLDFKSTQIYIHINQKELHKSLENSFKNVKEEKLQKLLDLLEKL